MKTGKIWTILFALGIFVVAAALPIGFSWLVWPGIALACTGFFGGFRQANQMYTQLERERAIAADAILAKEEEKAEAFRSVRIQQLQAFRELSHGLRVPISVITGYADLLMDGYVQEEATAREYIRKIRDHVGYIDDLLTQMLMEMRNDDGISFLMSKKLDLLALLREIAQNLAPILAGRGVVLQIHSAEDELWIHGDAVRLQKMFHNIFDNSLKYMGRDGVVTATCTGAEEEVLVIIKDNGKGMPAQEVDKIFDLNYQGSNKKNGYGLGLHLVREVVKAHGGTVSAKSDIDNGLGLYIRLPAAHQEIDIKTPVAL